MKSYLLDTHAMIWAAIEPKKLSKTARAIIENPENEILVNNISFWEISLKYALQKLDLSLYTPEDFPSYCTEMGFKIMPFSSELAATFHSLQAKHHKDPFDRMLIHTAIRLRIPLISKDENIKLYETEGLKVIW